MKPQDWENPRPQTLLEWLYFPVMWATVLRPINTKRAVPAERSQPEPPFSTLRFCRECGKRTIHNEFEWRTEGETTIECTECWTVWVKD